MPANRFANIFGLAKELGIEKETLSSGAAEWTGIESLRSLSAAQLKEYELRLHQRILHQWRLRRAAIGANFQSHATLGNEQRIYLMDLISSIFRSIEEFRVWLENHFTLSSERFITSSEAHRIIKALNTMRQRRFSTLHIQPSQHHVKRY
jgi:hypothetical protein